LDFFSYGGSGAVRFQTPAGSLSVGQWYMVAVQRSGTTYTLFINGVAVTSVTATENYSNTVLQIEIGRYNFGYIDHLRVSNSARSPSWTPATASFYTNDANTLLICEFDDC
jgi:hypothetical protein